MERRRKILVLEKNPDRRAKLERVFRGATNDAISYVDTEKCNVEKLDLRPFACVITELEALPLLTKRVREAETSREDFGMILYTSCALNAEQIPRVLGRIHVVDRLNFDDLAAEVLRILVARLTSR